MQMPPRIIKLRDQRACAHPRAASRPRHLGARRPDDSQRCTKGVAGRAQPPVLGTVSVLKAVEANFLKFLNKSDQLEVPIYQRTYSWTRPECLQLWNDVVRAAHDDVSGHFIGSIVYIDTGIYQVMGANAIEVIDGQQRLTTISLLLLAVARAMEADGAGNAGTARKLVKDYLLQDEDVDPGMRARYKLLLTKSDRD